MPDGNYEYKGLEKNNQLELFETYSTDIDYTIEEEGKYYIKGDSFENDNKWLLFKKKSSMDTN